MEATAGFEPAIEVLQTSALPLGYVAVWLGRRPWSEACAVKCLERKAGFEPVTLALARRCSTTELLPLDGAAGQS